MINFTKIGNVKLISSSQQKPIMDESSMSLLKFFLDGGEKKIFSHLEYFGMIDSFISWGKAVLSAFLM